MLKAGTDNMRIWNDVCMTDPKHTKESNFGRKITSISAQYQVQRATEQFGPVGEGWGYNVDYDFKQLPNDICLVFAHVTIWHGDKTNKFGPVSGCNAVLDKTKAGDLRLDDDAAKKAMTDALTKGLSHLGFSADVFLGMYDDDKYVQKAMEMHTPSDKYDEWSAKAVTDVNSFDNGDALEAFVQENADMYAEAGKKNKGAARAFAAAVQTARANFLKGEAA